MESKEFIELLDFLIELSGGEEIDLDYDPYKPGRVQVLKKDAAGHDRGDRCSGRTEKIA